VPCAGDTADQHPLKGTEDKQAKGFLAGYDMPGARFYVWPLQGEARVYRMRGLGKHAALSDDSLMKELYPGFDLLSSVTLMRFETIERSF
jgi:hypothetical protein